MLKAKSKKEMKRIIAGIVKRIVREFHPDKIILFGSQARGTAGPDSDVDLLVVMSVEGSKFEKSIQIGLALNTFRIPLDIVVRTPQDLERRWWIPGTIERPALLEGKVLYHKT
ncbi:MAG: nucleotidyltransferase domain-containing protein [Planctomycetota bacterium]